jgi:hypothetical protein
VDDWGWAGWDGHEFRRYKHPYELGGKLPFDVVPIEGREIAVVHSPITPDQRSQLLASRLPEWIDVLVTAHEAGPNNRIEVESVKTEVNPATIAAAVVTAYRSHGKIEGERADCVVDVMGEGISVSFELDYGDPNDGLPPTLTVRTRSSLADL